MTRSKVLLLGATGGTGSSILDGILEYGQADIVALVRPVSVNKPAVLKLKERGVEIRVGDSTDPVEKLVELLKGIDVVISTISAVAQTEQLALVEAAKIAGVKRFIPCGFITVVPPGGVMHLRDEKEVVYQRIRVLGLGYTFVDCGYWYQISFPALPSGRVDAQMYFKDQTIYGSGDVKTGITDIRDIGKYVARIIDDERTLNQFVYFFGEVTSQNEIFKLFEALSGESITPTHVSKEDLEAIISTSRAALKAAQKPTFQILRPLFGAEYNYSKFIRGDNTPDYAKYLGYIDAVELYPDVKPLGWKKYLEDLLAGKTELPYPSGIENMRFE